MIAQAAAVSSRIPRYLIISALWIVLLLVIFVLPEAIFVQNIMAMHAPPPQVELRGRQSSKEELEQAENIARLQEQFTDISKRIDAIDNQKFDGRMLVIEARLDTMFELGRIILGAAVLYIFQVLAQLGTWAIRKAKPTIQAGS